MGIKVRKGGVWVEVSSGGGGSSEPVGTIVAWAGSVASIPSDYQLCNGGAASTSELQAITGANVPDLRDRFIVGAGNNYAVDATGGSANATLVSHSHGSGTLGGSTNQKGGQSRFNPSSPSLSVSNLSGDSILSSINSNQGEETDFNNGDLLQIDTRHTHTVDVNSGSTSTEGDSATNANLPPYYALCYIIKHTATSGGGSGGVAGTTKVAIIRDQKNSNVDGGYTDKVSTGENGSWNDRDLTVKDDPFSFVTLYPTANGQTTYSRGKTPGYFSLPAGTYKIRFKTGGIQIYEHLGALIWSKTQSDISSVYDYTVKPASSMDGYFYGTTAISKGYNPSASVQNYDLTYSTGSNVVTITETTYFKVIHFSNFNPGAEYAFGSRIHSADNIDKNNYTIIEVEDLATAVKDTGITIKDEGSALSTVATTLNFVGSGVVASGTGAEKTITISGGGSGSGGTDAGQGFFENDTTLNTSTTLSSNKNVGVFGPYTIGNNVTLTVPTGTTFTVV